MAGGAPNILWVMVPIKTLSNQRPTLNLLSYKNVKNVNLLAGLSFLSNLNLRWFPLTNQINLQSFSISCQESKTIQLHKKEEERGEFLCFSFDLFARGGGWEGWEHMWSDSQGPLFSLWWVVLSKVIFHRRKLSLWYFPLCAEYLQRFSVCRQIGPLVSVGAEAPALHCSQSVIIPTVEWS